MKYPEEFIEKVKAVFPDWKNLHEALDNGNVMVGYYLDRPFEITLINIVLAFNEGRELEIKKTAEKLILRRDLLGEWSNLYKEYKKAQ